MKCQDVMSLNPDWISSTANALEAARAIRDHATNYLLVFDPKPGPGNLRGILTERDLAVRVCAEGKLAQNTSVMEVATPEVLTCGANEDLRDAEARMREFQKNRLVVVDQDGQVLGTLALSDILKHERTGPAARTARSVLASEADGHVPPLESIQLTPSTPEDEEAALSQPSVMVGASRVTSMKVFPGT
jgi:signal-transduction protein with cAMP-binding, CBS, and nucleotidyltransferase domain